MARRNSPTVNGVRYFLFVVGALILFGSNSSSSELDGVDALAVAFVIVGFPYFVLEWAFRLVAWVLGLFGIGKRKRQAAPTLQTRVTVEWADTPATEKQLGFIRHLGGNPPEGLTKSAASEMIDALLLEKDEERLAKAKRSTRRKKGGGT